jgi:septal ring factor EnvC (AmiA/AmiB activator)
MILLTRIFSISLLIYIFFAGLPIASAEDSLRQESAELRENTTGLEKDWEKEKREYKKKFEEHLKAIEEQLKEIEKQLDYGNADKREQLNQQMFKLWRARARTKRQVDELKAATAIDWANVKSDIDDYFAGIKEKITGEAVPKEY